MNHTAINPRANNARLDNRWGCSVGHAFHNFNPRSPLDAPQPQRCQRLSRYAESRNIRDALAA